ncbi:MAG: recombinase family protein [Oscillospiraceae bacterium]|nr:recombinase family protein [Oscillospiraceae bacterium]
MIAIYVRQSVDKKDSISIETQIETCKGKILSSNTEKTEVFSDKGFSGKSAANRPEFQRMMSEVRQKNISKIIVYKLDRISRSLIDFITMREEFQKYNVELVSCAEDFDTSTSTGKLMLNMLMMFAEMERETIQKRATDNFYARGEKGFYLSGREPFGYNKIEIYVEGKKTYTLEKNKEESTILKKMFSDYFSGKSMGDISRWLNNSKIAGRKNRPWSNNNVSRILRSPVYVKANADVYNYLVGLGAKMNNDIEEYIGKNGCYVYGNPAERKGIKFSNLSTDFVTLGLHEGIIEPSLWLGVQYIINQKQKHSNLGFGNLTWLQGLIKCKCGYTLYVKKCVNRKHKNPIEYKYLYCKGKDYDTCRYFTNMIRSSKVEEIVEAEIITHLNNLKNIQPNEIEKDNPELNALKIQAAKIDEQIDGYVKQFENLSEVTIKYLDDAIKKLDSEKKILIDKINDIQLKANRSIEIDIDIDEVINNWFDYEMDVKKAVSKKIIEKIILDGEEINIIFY